MEFIAIIPARYASTRFPGKPLADLGGKPIVEHVYERVARLFENTYVATDDGRIARTVEGFGGRVVMTRSDHRSGTDRCYEAFTRTGVHADVIVNVQGDEPFIAASQLEAVKRCFNDDATQIATLVQPYAADTPLATLENPNSPKVVVDGNDYALYFSRSVIPYIRGVEPQEWAANHTFYKHIGIYAYRADVLKRLVALPQSTLERAESLEQLRWLQAGFRIKVGYTDTETIGIDTPADLERARDFWNSLSNQAL